MTANTNGLQIEFGHRPSYSTRLCLYVIIKRDGETITQCSHTHGTKSAPERCANRLIQTTTQQETTQ